MKPSQEEAVKRAVEKEREECAQIADRVAAIGAEIATSIRDRSKLPQSTQEGTSKQAAEKENDDCASVADDVAAGAGVSEPGGRMAADDKTHDIALKIADEIRARRGR
jgi:hypothetical protein